MKTAVIFGVFDGIHDGHRAFIDEANKYGDRVIAIVARDSAVEKLKGKRPAHTELERLEEIGKMIEIDESYLGDEKEGKYEVLKNLAPDIVCFGYDQEALRKDIESKIASGALPKMEILVAKPHEPDTLHSSILKNNK
jgi:FAD synthetase